MHLVVVYNQVNHLYIAIGTLTSEAIQVQNYQILNLFLEIKIKANILKLCILWLLEKMTLIFIIITTYINTTNIREKLEDHLSM